MERTLAPCPCSLHGNRHAVHNHREDSRLSLHLEDHPAHGLRASCLVDLCAWVQPEHHFSMTDLHDVPARIHD